MQNGGDNLHETAAKGVEAIHMLVGERDDLMTKNDRMERDIALMREKIAQLESRLTPLPPSATTTCATASNSPRT